MTRDVTDRWCERGILFAILAILVFAPLATGAVRTLEFIIVQGLTLLVMLLWTVRLVLNQRQRLFLPPVCWAVLVFSAYAIGRYWTADIEYVARIELVRVLVYTFLFLAIVNNVNRREHSRIIGLTLVFLAMGIASYAIYQFVTGSQKVWFFTTPYTGRGTGTFISPNNLAGFLEMTLPLALAWTLASRAGATLKIFTAYASLVILAGIVVTISRGAWISVGLMLPLFFGVVLVRRGYRLASLAMLAVIVAAGFYVVPRIEFVKHRFQQLTTEDGALRDGRFELWRPAVEMWRDNPAFGVGPNHFNYRYREYRPPTQQRQPDRVHNDYLNCLVDWGFVGAGIVAVGCILLAMGAIRAWTALKRERADGDARKSNSLALLLGASLGLLAILFHSMTDFNLHIPANAILAVTLAGILTGRMSRIDDGSWSSGATGARVTAILILAAGIGILGWQGTRRTMEYVWHERAQRAANYSDERIAALEKAFAVEPKNFTTAYSIGEAYRIQSWEGAVGFENQATQAMKWFKRSTELNRHHGNGYVGYAMCLDWLGKTDESQMYYDRAIRLDPNGYMTTANMGWHYVQTGDYAAARTWFERSLRLEWKENPIARTYGAIVVQRMLENATNTAPKLSLPDRY